ncbi:MAG: hypothetical protein E7352_01445 [Clostridiales bacterium]|nr:hypothetical protein [Clostridiales bacterium]
MAKFRKTAALLTALLLCGSLLTTVACGDKDNVPPVGSSPSDSVSSPVDDESSDLSDNTSDDISDGTSDSDDNSDSSSDAPDEPLPEPTVFQLENHTWTAWETVTEKTCTTDGEEKLVCTDEGCGAVKTRKIKAGHVWGSWTGSTNHLCTQDAELSRICAICDEVDTQTIAMRGHVYQDGECTICNTPFVYPTLSENPSYVDVWDTSIYGSGGSFDRKALQMNVYYTLEVPASDTESADYGVWISVPADAPGQYALLTIGGTNGVSIDRFDASDYYIPGNDYGYIGFPATAYENGEAYSIADCGETYWNPQWRATWRFSAESNTTVKFVIVKIAPPEWSPAYLHKTAIPQEINNVKANEAPENYTATLVDYNDDYYYDEWNGVYRRGTKDNPGEVIYVAIDSPAGRLLGDRTFTTIQNDGNNLSLHYGFDEQGNYLIRDYHAFLMSSEAVNGNAYQNYVNSDGFYPVTKELQEFLYLYTQKNRPVNIPDSIWENEDARAQKAWLAPCYYYEPATLGTEEFPYILTALGDFEAKPAKFDLVYFTIKYTDETAAESYTLTLSCNDTNAMININGKTYTGPFSVDIDVPATKGLNFYIGAKNGAETTFTLTLSKPTMTT